MLPARTSPHRRSTRLAVGLALGGAAGLVGLAWHQARQDQRMVAQRRPTPPPALTSTPLVSVLVAAWNEAAHIEAHIQSFLALSYPQCELILCAGGTDQTLPRAQAYRSERVRVLPQAPGEGKQRALARCFEHARGEIIYLTDADCLYNDGALQRLVAALVNEGEQVATGRFEPFPALWQHPFVVHQHAVDTYARAHSGRYVGGLIGRNALLSRAALVGAGGLAAEVTIGTDYYLARRLIAGGHQIRYIHESSVVTSYHTTLRPYLRQQTRWLRNIVIHGRRFGAGAEVAGALRNCGVGALMVGLPLVALVGGPLVWVLWLLALLHGTLNRWRYLRFLASLGHSIPRQAVVRAPVYVMVDFVMLAVAGWDIAFRRQDRW